MGCQYVRLIVDFGRDGSLIRGTFGAARGGQRACAHVTNLNTNVPITLVGVGPAGFDDAYCVVKSSPGFAISTHAHQEPLQYETVKLAQRSYK